MAVSIYFNRVKYTPTLGGTGDFVTSAVVTGFRTPADASIGNGSIVSYVAFSSTQAEWETGQGTYTSATQTLARTTVRESSNAGAKVNFTSAPTVALDFQAQDITNLPPVAINGAAIGANALAVTGTSLFGGNITVPQGSSSAPGIQWTGAGTTTGFWASTTNRIVFTAGGGNRFEIFNSGFLLASGGLIGWTSAADPAGGSFDTNLSRNAAGITQFGTTAANAAGSWLATNGTLSGTLVAGGTALQTGSGLTFLASIGASGKALSIDTNGIVWLGIAAGSPTTSNYTFFNVNNDLTINAITSISFASGNTAFMRALPLAFGGYGGTSQTYVYWTGDSSVGSASTLHLRREASNNLGIGQFIRAGHTTPDAQILTIGEVTRAGTDSNVAGSNGTVQSAAGTGNATGSSLILQTPTAVASGTGPQTYATRLTLNETMAAFSGAITTLGGAVFHITSTALTDGGAAQIATLTNGPTAGNPTKWIGINDNGTTRYIPAW